MVSISLFFYFQNISSHSIFFEGDYIIFTNTDLFQFISIQYESAKILRKSNQLHLKTFLLHHMLIAIC